VPPYDEAIEVTLTADGDQAILVIEVRGMPLDAIAFYGVGWQLHAETLAANPPHAFHSCSPAPAPGTTRLFPALPGQQGFP
jgi:hypothetical protein